MNDLSFLTFFASLCSGISVSCLTLSVFHLMEQMKMEKQETAKALPILLKIFLPFASNIIPLVQKPFLENSRKRTKELILMAGYDQVIDEDHFIADQILIAIIGVLCLLAGIFFRHPLMGLLVMILFLIYPKLWLKKTVERRHLEIQKALPNVLDLLTLSVEAGKDFLTSLRDILARRRRRDALGEELERTFQEIQLGKQRRHALQDLSRRVQQPDLTAVLNAIIQADELGVSIGHILRIQGDQFRTKRFQRAEKLANEAPVKILFPLVLFILPAVIIILMGPVIMKGLNILFK